MPREMTITLDETVYEGLCRMVEPRKISQFIEDMLRPHVLDQALTEAELEESYRAMAADEAREAEAQEWCNALIGDVPDEPW